MPFDSLRESRAEVEAWLTERNLDATLSAPRYLLHRKLASVIGVHASGRVLEAGSGHSPFSSLLAETSDSVVRMDSDPTRGNVDVVGDIQNMSEFEDESFDTVLCTQVLEHVPDPRLAIAEMCRVLKSGGVLILSVPHLSLVHEAPNDYFRFTSFAIRSLISAENLTEIELTATGGLVAFMSHPVSLLLWTAFGRVPLLLWPVWLLNYSFVMIVVLLDRFTGLRSLYPTDHVLIATKPSQT